MMPPSNEGLPGDLPRLAPRATDSHKRTYGRVVIVAGSRGMAGAAALVGMASLRSGAGLVELVVPASVQPTVAGFDPCLMTCGVPEDTAGRFAATALAEIQHRCEAADVVAVGPGLGRNDDLTEIVCDLWCRLPQPAVFDADALWAVAQATSGLRHEHNGPRIMTPHAGEMLRLLGAAEPQALPEDRPGLEAAARELARAAGIVMVLKGHRTFVTDGDRGLHSASGNPGLATGGTGDVLTGVIAALLGQGLPPRDAAQLGVWIHGRAGDLAAERFGMVSMTARDVIDHLPGAFRELG